MDNVELVLYDSVAPKDCNKCTLCSLRTNVVSSYLPVDAEILFLTEAPGETEDTYGDQPFIGPPGKYFDELLKRLRIDRERVALACTVRCRPRETNEKKIEAGARNRPPKDSEIKACGEYLDIEIKALKNLKVIVCLGATAVKRMFGKTGMNLHSLRGKVHHNETYGNIVVTHHPARSLHLQSTNEKLLIQTEMLEDIQLAYSLVVPSEYNVPITQQSTYNHYIIRSISQARWLFSELMNCEYFAFDSETDRFDYLTVTILCLSFSWSMNTGVVLPLVGQDYKVLWKDEELEEIWKSLKEVFENKNSKKIAQNAKFDMQQLFSKGIHVENLFADTMIMHYLIDEDSEHDLKSLAWMYTDVGGYELPLDELKVQISKELNINKTDISFVKFPEEILWKYSAFDADVTFRIFWILYPKLVEEELEGVMAEIYIPMIYLLSEVEYYGVNIDLPYLDKVIIDFQNMIDEKERELYSVNSVKSYVEDMRKEYREKRLQKWEVSKNLQSRYPDKDEYANIKIDTVVFNSNSAKQLRELFVDRLKLPVLKKTASGAASTDAEVLGKYASKVPAAKVIAEKSKLTTLLSTFLIGARDRIRVDNHLHSSFNLHVARTGRLSSTSVNLQNVPNKTNNAELATIVRRMFKPDDEESIIVEADQKQAEFRVWGQMSGDPVMYEDLRNGLDVHRKFASIGSGILEEDDTYDQRNGAKGVVFGTIYGRSPKSVADQLNIPVKKAENIQRALFDRYKYAEKWIKDTIQFAHKNGYVKGLFNQRRHLKNAINHPDNSIRSGAERQAVNSPIQGSASQMTGLAGVIIYKRFKEEGIRGRILMFIHDAIVMSIKKADFDKALPIIDNAMKHPHPSITIPLGYDMKGGENWGDAKEIKYEPEKL